MKIKNIGIFIKFLINNLKPEMLKFISGNGSTFITVNDAINYFIYFVDDVCQNGAIEFGGSITKSGRTEVIDVDSTYVFDSNGIDVVREYEF